MTLRDYLREGAALIAVTLFVLALLSWGSLIP